jgi:hypothetical protein
MERFAMSSRATRLGLALATTLTAGLVGLPASSVIAADPGAAPRQATVQTPPVMLVNVSGLYEFNFGGHTGWVLLKHNLRSNALLAWVHEDGQTRRVPLQARYDAYRKLVRLSRIHDGYRYEYFLYAAQKSPRDRLDFGGYFDKYELGTTAQARTYVVAREGVSVHYVADDAD